MEVHKLAAAKKRKVVKRARNGTVQITMVNRAVWRTALDLARGSVRRIQIVDADTVIVHNRPRGLPRSIWGNVQ